MFILVEQKQTVYWAGYSTYFSPLVRHNVPLTILQILGFECVAEVEYSSTELLLRGKYHCLNTEPEMTYSEKKIWLTFNVSRQLQTTAKRTYNRSPISLSVVIGPCNPCRCVSLYTFRSFDPNRKRCLGLWEDYFLFMHRGVKCLTTTHNSAATVHSIISSSTQRLVLTTSSACYFYVRF